MYHSIGNNSAFFTVSAEQFDLQMRYLAQQGYSVVSVSDMVSHLERHTALPPKSVVLTFDDGYRDNYDYAFPILKKYGFPASIFLTTGALGASRTTRSGVTLPMLDAVQIREMQRSGLVAFYPHTDSHPKLDTLPDEDVRREIVTSDEKIQQLLNSESSGIFAYPYGSFNERVRAVLHQLGYRAAFTVRAGTVTSDADVLRLNRNSIDSAVTMAMFRGIVQRGRYS